MSLCAMEGVFLFFFFGVLRRCCSGFYYGRDRLPQTLLKETACVYSRVISSSLRVLGSLRTHSKWQRALSPSPSFLSSTESLASSSANVCKSSTVGRGGLGHSCSHRYATYACDHRPARSINLQSDMIYISYVYTLLEAR